MIRKTNCCGSTGNWNKTMWHLTPQGHLTPLYPTYLQFSLCQCSQFCYWVTLDLLCHSDIGIPVHVITKNKEIISIFLNISTNRLFALRTCKDNPCWRPCSCLKLFPAMCWNFLCWFSPLWKASALGLFLISRCSQTWNKRTWVIVT